MSSNHPEESKFVNKSGADGWVEKYEKELASLS
jgi:hypothetical protein